jgi:ABC-2 type transport system ATP-binding protein
MTQKSYALQAEGLRKSFGPIEAVRGVSFQVESGEILGLLGPNGAGKSTTISMLCGLVAPDGGEARICGHAMDGRRAARAALGLVPQDIALYEDLSARENLRFWGRMYGLGGAALEARIDEVLSDIGLTDRQKGRISTFSGGMKRRVNIGAAILHRPSVVIMDEPTVGIDPQSRRHILDGVKELNRAGTSVLYTTHYMEEASELSDRIAIMDRGEIIAIGSQEELMKTIGSDSRITLGIEGEVPDSLESWGRIDGVTRLAPSKEGIIALAPDSALALPRLFEAAARNGLRVVSAQVAEPNLESLFLHLTGRALRDGAGA